MFLIKSTNLPVDKAKNTPSIADDELVKPIPKRTPIGVKTENIKMSLMNVFVSVPALENEIPSVIASAH